jgi:hypothetical protein
VHHVPVIHLHPVAGDVLDPFGAATDDQHHVVRTGGPDGGGDGTAAVQLDEDVRRWQINGA